MQRKILKYIKQTLLQGKSELVSRLDHYFALSVNYIHETYSDFEKSSVPQAIVIILKEMRELLKLSCVKSRPPYTEEEIKESAYLDYISKFQLGLSVRQASLPLPISKLVSPTENTSLDYIPIRSLSNLQLYVSITKAGNPNSVSTNDDNLKLLLVFVATHYLPTYSHGRSCLAVYLMIDILSVLFHDPLFCKELIGTDLSCQLFHWLIQINTEGLMGSLQARIGYTTLLTALVQNYSVIPKGVIQTSPRLLLFPYFKSANVLVKFSMTSVISSLFGNFSLDSHNELYDDVFQHLDNDESVPGALAFRALSLEKIIYYSAPARKIAIYNLIEIGKFERSREYATFCFERLARKNNLQTCFEFIGNYWSQVIWSWINFESTISTFPSSVIDGLTYSKWLYLCQEEVTAQLLLFGHNDEFLELSNRDEASCNQLIDCGFARSIAYAVIHDGTSQFRSLPQIVNFMRSKLSQSAIDMMFATRCDTICAIMLERMKVPSEIRGVAALESQLKASSKCTLCRGKSTAHWTDVIRPFCDTTEFFRGIQKLSEFLKVSGPYTYTDSFASVAMHHLYVFHLGRQHQRNTEAFRGKLAILLSETEIDLSDYLFRCYMKYISPEVFTNSRHDSALVVVTKILIRRVDVVSDYLKLSLSLDYLVECIIQLAIHLKVQTCSTLLVLLRWLRDWTSLIPPSSEKYTFAVFCGKVLSICLKYAEGDFSATALSENLLILMTNFLHKPMSESEANMMWHLFPLMAEDEWRIFSERLLDSQYVPTLNSSVLSSCLSPEQIGNVLGRTLGSLSVTKSPITRHAQLERSSQFSQVNLPDYSIESTILSILLKRSSATSPEYFKYHDITLRNLYMNNYIDRNDPKLLSYIPVSLTKSTTNFEDHFGDWSSIKEIRSFECLRNELESDNIIELSAGDLASALILEFKPASFYRCLLYVIQKDAKFAEEILPLLLEAVDTFSLTSSRKRDALTDILAITQTVLTTDATTAWSTNSKRMIIRMLLHVFRMRTLRGQGLEDMILYLNSILKVCLQCSEYNTALLFLEFYRNSTSSALETSNYEDALQTIYEHIDEPDSITGLIGHSTITDLIEKFSREENTENANRLRRSVLESDILYSQGPHSWTLYVEALKQTGLFSIASQLFGQSTKLSTYSWASENRNETSWRTLAELKYVQHHQNLDISLSQALTILINAIACGQKSEVLSSLLSICYSSFSMQWLTNTDIQKHQSLKDLCLIREIEVLTTMLSSLPSDEGVQRNKWVTRWNKHQKVSQQWVSFSGYLFHLVQSLCC